MDFKIIAFGRPDDKYLFNFIFEVRCKAVIDKRRDISPKGKADNDNLFVLTAV